MLTRGLFITGTDTGIGKTVVAAALIHRFRDELSLCYWKPIQTGIELDDDTSVVQMLGQCSDSEIFASGVRLPRPLSPHLAARLAGERIDRERLAQMAEARPCDSAWLVEGAGGALVPISDAHRMTDLMSRLGLGVLVVARSTLGTINHTLLTLEALRNRTLRIAGVVMVGPPNSDNRDAIKQFGDVSIVAEMPFFASLTPEVLCAWARIGMDPAGLLKEFLQ